MKLDILYIAYPLLAVSEESAGGAEQMLWTLEREMAVRGAATTVAAAAGSRVQGELLDTGEPCTQLDDFERRNRRHQEKILEYLAVRTRQGRPFDLIHDESGSFWPRAAKLETPVLATLHLPRDFYPPQYFENIPANVSFNCVSQSQAQSFSSLRSMLGVVANGIPLDRFQPGGGARHGLLWLGRICEEKGTHLALEIAARAGRAIRLAGQVYPFSYHRQYFEREIAPRLRDNPQATFIPSPSARRKQELLGEAQALLITSLVEETSSLAAMEAAASGTPAIAFRRGALPGIVKDGVTGFLADGVEEAVEAIGKLGEIRPGMCLRQAQEYFSGQKMADGYAHLYDQVTGNSTP